LHEKYLEQEVNAQCPFHPSSCSCPAGTTYKRCTGGLCQKCVCGTGRDPGACMLGNGGGVIWTALGSIFGIGKKK